MKPRRIAIAIVGVTLAASASAQTALDMRPKYERMAPQSMIYQGKTYRSASVSSVEADKVEFNSTDGSFEMPWSAVPFNLKRQLDEKHKEALAREANRRARQRYQEQAATVSAQLAKDGGITLVGKVLQVLPVGLLVICDQDDRASTARLRLQGELQEIPLSAAPPRYFGTVLLKNHPEQKQIVDDDPIAVIALPAGTYQYTSTVGAQKTIRAFSMTRPRATPQP